MQTVILYSRSCTLCSYMKRHVMTILWKLRIKFIKIRLMSLSFYIYMQRCRKITACVLRFHEPNEWSDFFQIIKARVKEMMIPRFKIICTVHIGELKNSGLWVGSRCLWDASCDTYSTFEYRNKTLFAIGTVFGVYYEWGASCCCKRWKQSLLTCINYYALL